MWKILRELGYKGIIAKYGEDYGTDASKKPLDAVTCAGCLDLKAIRALSRDGCVKRALDLLNPPPNNVQIHLMYKLVKTLLMYKL